MIFEHEIQDVNLIITSLEHKARDIQLLIQKLTGQANAQIQPPVENKVDETVVEHTPETPTNN